jgi:hypothetical protein
MEMVKFFEFFAIVPEIPGLKHHEIQEFGQNTMHIICYEILKFHIKHSLDPSAL